MGVKWGGGQKSILNCFRYKNALKKTSKNESFSERQYLKKKCFKAWSFPRQLLPPYLIVLGGQKCNLSDEIKTPGFFGYIHHVWLHSVCSQKPVFTPDFAITILMS